jgi:iron complex outermembrane receptor protein
MNKHFRLFAYTASIVGLMGADHGFAQTAASADSASTASGLEEIVVTARRREEKLQSVPVTITAFKGADLELHSIQNFSDLVHLVPGLSLQELSRGNASAVRVRGFTGVAGYFADAPQGIQPAANGAGVISSVGGYAQYVDLDTIEVDKGPQGTLFGLNALGGAIQFQPKRPTDHYEGYVQYITGSYNRQQVTAAVSIPIVEDKLMLRLAGERHSEDGYTYDSFSKKDLDNLDYWYGRVGITFRPTDDLQNYLVADSYHQDDNGPTYPLDAVNPKGTAAALNPTLVAYLATQQALGPREVRTNVANPNSFYQFYRVVDILTYDFSDDFSIKNVASWQRTALLRNQQGDIDSTPLNIFAYFSPAGGHNPRPATEYLSEELQFHGKSFGEKLNWVVGGFLSYFHPDDPGIQYQFATTVLGGLSTGITSNHNSSRDQAVFAQATYDLSGLFGLAPDLQGLHLTGGYRYNYNWVSQVSRVTNAAGVCTLVGADKNCTLAADRQFNAPGWTLGMDYQMTPNTLLYVTAGNAYSAGGFNVGSNPPAAFQPQYLTNVEIGIKSDWTLFGMKARTNIDAYHADYSNLQVNTVVLVTNALGVVQPLSLIRNAAQATGEGIEFEGELIPTENVEIKASYATNHLRYDVYNSLNAARQVISLADNDFQYVPVNRFSLTGVYHLPLDSAWGQVTLSGTYSWQAHEYYSPTSTDPDAIVPSYGLLDMRIDWNNIMQYPVDASFFVTNAADTVHKSVVFANYASLGFAGSGYAPPRMFGVQLKYHFDETAAISEASAAYTPPPVVAAAPSTPKSYLVFFDFNKSDLTSQATAIVDQAAKNAGPAKVTKLEVTGHTDTVGSDAYNMRLSRRRAESVAAQLVKDGIPSSEIAIVAKGKRDLLVPTADGVKEPQNRRVQIVYEGGPTS